MKPAWRHLRHPLRTARSAIALAAARWQAASLLYRGHRRYRNDSRYDLASVSKGFVSHPSGDGSDESLLKRICAAYSESIKREQQAAAAYAASPWWELQRKWSLKPVIQALERHDIAALGRMYENFFRNSCSAGLIAAQDSAKSYFGETFNERAKRLYLIDFLYCMDYWTELLGKICAPKDLAGPMIGNPYGVVLDGTLITRGAAYHHYCAHRICGLLPDGEATVVEIGGGYGGMAYYLLRDRPGTRYLDFDVPETCALAAYYLLTAFPGLRVVLCGEAEIASTATAEADVVLLPVSELANMTASSADVVFSSYTMSDLSTMATSAYLKDIERITRGDFLYIGTGAGGKLISELATQRYQSLRLTEMPRTGWHRHTAPSMEYLFDRDRESPRRVPREVEEVTRGT